MGILLGTRFSSKAKSAKAAPPRTRQTLAAGAANLNFVLSIVFGATVSIMSFTFGANAIESLRVYPEYKDPEIIDGEYYYDPTWTVSTFEWKWFFESMLPALVLLMIAAIGIYLFITERNQSSIVKPARKAAGKVAAKPASSVKKTATKAKAATKSATSRKRK
jgi:H+/gluconate symporter-like permease